MAVSTVTELVALLREQNILPPAQLQVATADMEKDFPDAKIAAESLIRRKLLTTYQFQQIFSETGAKNLVFGPYVLLEPLGEGGMGQVFKARHNLLDRIVALKLIREQRLSQDAEAVKRFQREAKAAAVLSHPNIVTVYDLGLAGDAYYIAMEYIEGTDLAHWVRDRGPLPVPQACDFIRQAALGLAHAHENSMVHRDIKPGNLLATGLILNPQASPARGLSRIGSRPAVPGARNLDDVRARLGRDPKKTLAPEPKPVIKILDMGLVRVVADADDGRAASASLTQEGSIVGTPDYIAPEQARNAHKVDIRADLYSLGATMYFLLTGQPPFPEGSAIEKLLMHQLDEPVPVKERRPEVPKEVAKIVHKLLAKSPLERYQTPTDLADELEAMTFERPEPKLAPKPPEGKRTYKEIPAPSLLNPPTPKPMPVAATPPPSMPLKSPPNATPNAPANSPPMPPPTVRMTGAKAESPPPNPAMPKPGERRSGPSTPVPEMGVAASVYKWKDGKSGSDETEVDPRLPAKHIAALPPKGQTGHSGCVMALAFSPDRDTLASGGVDSKIHLWDFSGPKPRSKASLSKHLDAVHALAFTPDNQMLASGSGGMDGLIWLWDLRGEAPRPYLALQGHKGSVDALGFSPDGKVLASGGSDATVRIWEMGAQPKHRSLLKGHVRPIKTVAFSPDGQTLASAAQDYTVRLWSLSRMWSKERAVLPHEGEVNSVAFSPDGKTVAVGCQDQTVRLWDVAGVKPTERTMLTGQKAVVRLVLIPPDGKTVIAVGEGRQIIVWDFATGNKLQEWLLPKSMATSYALTVDGRYLATGASDGPVNVYRVAEKRTHTSR